MDFLLLLLSLFYRQNKIHAAGFSLMGKGKGKSNENKISTDTRYWELKNKQTKKNIVSIIGNIDYLKKYQNRVLNLLTSLVLVINHKAELLICSGHQITPGWVSVLWYLHYHVEEQQTQI